MMQFLFQKNDVSFFKREDYFASSENVNSDLAKYIAETTKRIYNVYQLHVTINKLSTL